MEISGAPPQGAPAPVSVHHRHSGDKREGHDVGVIHRFEMETLQGHRKEIEVPFGVWHSHPGESGDMGWKAAEILRENGISMRRWLWGDIEERDLVH